MSAETAGFVCLYFGSGEDCWNCGGWLKAAGGPFDGDSRFCSEDCFADAAIRAEEIARRTAWCPKCGYDNSEHAPDCSGSAASEQPDAGASAPEMNPACPCETPNGSANG